MSSAVETHQDDADGADDLGADGVGDDVGDGVGDDVGDDDLAGVHARATSSAPATQVWQHLISPLGTQALLGDGARLGNKGEPWRASDGSHGVVRSFHPVDQVRVTWHPREDGPLSMLDVQLRPDGDKTVIEVFHEGRGIAGDPRGDLQHWDDALGRFVGGIPG